MAGIKPIEMILSEQRQATAKEISRLTQELEKIDALIRQAVSGTSPKGLTEKPGAERIGQGELSIDVDSRSLTERAREQIRKHLPNLGVKGGTVSDIACALSRNEVHIKNKMLSTILWRMAEIGDVEKYGSRRQTYWRLPQKNEASDAGTSDASVQR